MTTFMAICAACAALLGTPVMAEKVMSDALRDKEATDIVVGRVSDLYMKDVETELYGKGTIEHRYLVELQVESVERGSVRAKDVLYLRAWELARFPEGVKAACGPGGHTNIPKIGDKVRVYAVRGPYADANQDDNGYAAVYPTGFVKLEK
jgi:hypothetical protein